MSDVLTATVQGRRIDLVPPGPYLVGRHSDATIVVEDDVVSRRHLLIGMEDGEWVAEDLESSNGTFIDGSRISRSVLSVPLRILLGDPRTGVSLEFDRSTRSPSDAVAPPPPAASVREGDSAEQHDLTELGRILRVHRLREPEMTIGRADDNAVVLNDLQASRHHAVLRKVSDDEYELHDLDSFNGTFVDGERVSARRVASGGLIGIGSRVLRITGVGLEEYAATEHFPVAAKDLRFVTQSGAVLLDGVSFAVEESSMTAILGPSGAGKSTLLGALTGLQPATSGRVLCAGTDLYANYESLSRRIGYVPQDDLVQTELTVAQSIDYAAKLRFPPDVSARERDVRVAEVLNELGLAHRSDVRVGALSGGQRKRVSIALELLTKPSLIYLDEPTSGLDPGYERSVMMVLRRLADSGRTVVLVTHSVESLHLCDRVLCLAPGGRTAWFGPPEEMAEHFGRESQQEIFQLLDAQGALDHAATGAEPTAADPVELAQRYAASAAAQRYVATPLEAYEQALALEDRDEAPRKRSPAVRVWFQQVATLTSRYSRIIVSDRRTMTILVVTAPVLGLVLLLRLPPEQFADPTGPGPLFSQAALVVFIVAIGITQVATSTSVREIVKERAILSRERTVGVSTSAYLTSKVIVLGGLAIAQAVVIVGIATARQSGPDSGVALGSGRLELVVVGSLVALGAMALGLLVSAIVTSPDRVALILPAVLGFHVLVTAGEVMPAAPDIPVIEQARYLSTARWGFAAMASSVDVEQRGEASRLLGEASDMTLDEIAGLDSLDQLRRAAPVGADLTHRRSTWWRDVAVLIGITAALLGATMVALRRSRPLP